MRILLVSQMYPGPRAPALGTFVADLEAALAARGHELARAVVDRRGGRSRHLTLARDVVATARRFRPDVVYAHFLVPAGLFAVLGGRAPAVVTAHGQDVENALGSSAVRSLTRLTVRRAAGVVAVSDWLRDRLERAVPEARGRTEVIDCGVDLARFAPADPGAGPCGGGLAARGHRLRLCRLAQRAEERPAARPRVRAPGRGLARVRRGRPAAGRARGPRWGSTSPEPCPTRRCPAGCRRRTSSASRASPSRSGS